AAAREVAAQRVDGFAADRDDPLLRALPEAADDPLLEVDRRSLEPHGFADAKAGAVEELHECPVAKRSRAGARCRLDQAHGLAGGIHPDLWIRSATAHAAPSRSRSPSFSMRQHR